MGFRSGAYASVFSVKRGNGNYYDVNITTSHKDRSSGNYVRDFGAFVRFAGDAANVVKKYDGKTSKDNGNRPLARVKLGDVDTTNTFNAAKGITYTNHVVFTCEEVDGTSTGTGSTGNYSGNSYGNANRGGGNPMGSINDYVSNIPSDEAALFT